VQFLRAGRMMSTKASPLLGLPAGRRLSGSAFDLIYARPGQSLAELGQGGAEPSAGAFGTGHLSLYQLDHRTGPRGLRQLVRTGGTDFRPDECHCADCLSWNRSIMTTAGPARPI